MTCTITLTSTLSTTAASMNDLPPSITAHSRATVKATMRMRTDVWSSIPLFDWSEVLEGAWSGTVIILTL